MDLSICILTNRQPELLPICVEACLSEIKRAQIEAEIIIVDNASADRYAERLKSLSQAVRVIRNEQNLGFSAGNNVAIRSSRGRYVLILNDDAILQEGSLEILLREVRSHPEVGAVGPKLLNSDGSLQFGFTNKRFPRIRGMLCEFLPFNKALYQHAWTRKLFTEWNDGEQTGPTDYIAGACLLSPRAALNAVGLFDENFYFWFDDTDLCYRLKKAGYQVIYIAEVRAIHYGSASLRRLTRSQTYAIFLRSLNYYFKKHHSPLRRLAVQLSLALAYLVRIPAVFLLRLMSGHSASQQIDDSMKASLVALRVLLLESRAPGTPHGH